MSRALVCQSLCTPIVLLALAGCTGGTSHKALPPTSSTFASLNTRPCTEVATAIDETRAAREGAANDQAALPYGRGEHLIPRTLPGLPPDPIGGGRVHPDGLPEGDVTNARASLGSHGLIYGYDRQWQLPGPTSFARADVYQFPTQADALAIEESSIRRECERAASVFVAASVPGLLGTVDPVAGRMQTGALFVRGPRLFEVFSDAAGPLAGPGPLPGWASSLEANLKKQTVLAQDPANVAHDGAASACGRVANALRAQSITLGELRTALHSAIASVPSPAADPSAVAVTKALQGLLDSTAPGEGTYDINDATPERAAAVDDACRDVTAEGVFRL